MQNINLRSLGMCRKQNFVIVLGFKSDTAVSSITFHFLSSPLFSLFLPHFSSFAWHLVGFIFGKAFRILGLDFKKKVGGWWNKIFRSVLHCFLTGILDWIMLILIWFERSLHSTQVSRKSCHLPLKLMMSQAVEGRWIRTGGYRGKWVKRIFKKPLFFYNTCRSSWDYMTNTNTEHYGITWLFWSLVSLFWSSSLS